MYFLGVRGIDETDTYNWWDQQDIFAPGIPQAVKPAKGGSMGSRLVKLFSTDLWRPILYRGDHKHKCEKILMFVHI